MKKKATPPAAPANLCVQAGAYRNPLHADGLARRLHADGFGGRVVRYGSEPLHRVIMGPGSTRAEAERLLEQLRAKGYTDGYITVGR